MPRSLFRPPATFTPARHPALRATTGPARSPALRLALLPGLLFLPAGCGNDSDDAGCDYPTEYYRDADADGFGSWIDPVHACQQPSGYVAAGNDCDDQDPAIHPGATETCDGIDQDCDGGVDEALQLTWYADEDHDGYGARDEMIEDCAQPAGSVDNADDCDDRDSDVHPGGVESCDGIDQDCDGLVDDGVVTHWYRDLDEDDYGDPSTFTDACAQPSGHVIDNTDCDDHNSAANPGELEVCNGVDDNCDGAIDDGLLLVFHADLDDDLFGDAADEFVACVAPPGYRVDGSDCDDTDNTVYPGALEACNGIDDDCSGTADDGHLYVDADADGWGADAPTVPACDPAPGYVALTGDCDDLDPLQHPGAPEADNGIDDNCDGTIDDPYVAVAAGGDFSLALRGDGTVWSWGWNGYGQLGDGTHTERLTPVRVRDLDQVVAIAAGGRSDGWQAFGLALRRDGTVWAWGANDYLQLGSAGSGDQTQPLQALYVKNVVAIAAGASHAMAVTASGTVWTWGNDASGQLGTCTSSPRLPAALPDLEPVRAVAAGEKHSLALLESGSIRAWGFNNTGQLGNGSGVSSCAPIETHDMTDAVFLGAGAFHSLVVRDGGRAWGWGLNGNGQLGDGSIGYANEPVQAIGLEQAVSITGGSAHTLVSLEDGTLWAYGANAFGQLGDGTTTDRYAAVQVLLIEDVTTTSGGGAHSLAASADGTVWAWGDNYYGQLGDETTSSRSKPGRVSVP